MMFVKQTSVKQATANKINALSSTGATTEEGRARSSLNAVIHGLSGSDSLAPGLESLAKEDLETYKNAFRNEFRPLTLEQKRLVDAMAVESVRIDQAREAALRLMVLKAARAREYWEEDRIREGEAIYSKLPSDPTRWAVELEASTQGCSVMLERWRLLKISLLEKQTWTDDQRSIALDLIGHPREFRDGSSRVDPQSDNLYQARIELCDSEVNRLKAIVQKHLSTDAYERQQDEHGVYFILSKDGAKYDRYEQAADRRYERARKRLGELGCNPVKSTLQPPPKHTDVAVATPFQVEAPPEPKAEPVVKHKPECQQAVAAKVEPVAKPAPLQPTTYDRVAVSATPAGNTGLPWKVPTSTAKMNRQQRRAKAAKKRGSDG